MPSSYTHPVLENPDYTFEEFAWKCARELWPLWPMRGFPLDAKIPRKFEKDPYYASYLSKSEKDLKRLESFSEEEWWKWRDENTEAQEPRGAIAEQKKRCIRMLDKVRQWDPPTPDHRSFRQFMLKQLQEAINFDCLDPPPPLPQKTLEEFKRDELESARRRVSEAQAELEKQNRLTEERNAWIAKLRESIPIPAHLDGEIE